MRVVRALGVDVGVRKGLDLVLLDGDRRVLEAIRHLRVEALATTVGDLGPDVVAIDAPPDWARSGRSRRTERELLRFGIRCFTTPSDHRMADHPFYGWMTVGFAAFRAIEPSFPRYHGGSVKGTAIEVFPHASAVVLAGCLRPPGTRPHAWRREVLRAQGVDTVGLRGPDQVDAALAALTGALALEDAFVALGPADEGQIVLPASTLPPNTYARRPALAADLR